MINALKAINESFINKYKVDEALPDDLMQSIRKAADQNKNTQGAVNRFNRADQLYTIYNPETNSYDKVQSGVKDYANATYKEVSASDILRMKKDGEDLSNVYILKDKEMIALNSDGKPDFGRSADKNVRANQSLAKSLKHADKIYLADIKDAIEVDPEKMHNRMNDRDQRLYNAKLGKNRAIFGFEDRKKSDYVIDQKLKAQDIKALKHAYEAGKINSEEYKNSLANIKNKKSDKYASQEYNNIRNTNAYARNYASRKDLQEPIQNLKQARNEIRDAKKKLARDEEKLDKIKTDSTDTNGTFISYNYALSEIDRLTKQIAILQKSIDNYQSQIDAGAKQSEIDATERSMEASRASIEDAQNRIDQLLRRK